MVWGLRGAELGLEWGQAGLKSWRLGFRTAGKSHCTSKPLEVPHYPLKLMVIFGKLRHRGRATVLTSLNQCRKAEAGPGIRVP